MQGSSVSTKGSRGSEQSAPASFSEVERPVVRLKSGLVRGLGLDGVAQFRGVPYGAPTGGLNRFRPPRAVRPWAGVREAGSWGSMSPQSLHSPSSLVTVDPELYFKTFGQSYEQPLGEDCLNVHIWAPQEEAVTPRPVMVWVHGGGFDHGTAATARTDGTAFARDHDMVVVASSHRLGAVGYTYLGDIDPDYRDSVNVGMQDLVTCLKWVRDNIAAFGGDSHNVTVFCESGGGLKATTLLGMPAAHGLFHKLILQSAMPWDSVLMDREQATFYARKLLAALDVNAGRPLTPQLGDLGLDRLIQAQWDVVQLSATENGQPNGFGFSPFLDGEVITSTPLDALAEGRGAAMPLLAGFTSQEWGAMLSRDEGYVGIDETGLRQRMHQLLGADGDELVEIYLREFPELTPEQLLVRIVSHRWFLTSTSELTARRAAAGALPVWEYLFTWSSPERPELGAFHGSEGSFIFGTTAAVPLAQSDPGAADLARTVNGAWARFARAGDPSQPGFAWPPNPRDEHNVMILGGHIEVARDPFARLRTAWEAATEQANV